MSAQSIKAFKAIILAGGVGSQLTPFTLTQPKSLLPLINRPLLSYQFELLERSGFHEAIVITNSIHEDEMNEFIEQFKTTGRLSLNIKLLSTDCEDTADALRDLTSAKDEENILPGEEARPDLELDTDFVVITGDLVSSEPLQKLCALHRHRRATLTVMLTQPPRAPGSEKDKKSQSSSSDEEDNLFVGIDPSTGRLVYLRDPDADDGLMTLHKDVLKQTPNFTLYTNMKSPHIFAFSSHVLNTLRQQTNITNLSTFVHYLVALQFVKPDLRVIHQQPHHDALYDGIDSPGSPTGSMTDETGSSQALSRRLGSPTLTHTLTPTTLRPSLSAVSIGAGGGSVSSLNPRVSLIDIDFDFTAFQSRHNQIFNQSSGAEGAHEDESDAQNQDDHSYQQQDQHHTHNQSHHHHHHHKQQQSLHRTKPQLVSVHSDISSTATGTHYSSNDSDSRGKMPTITCYALIAPMTSFVDRCNTLTKYIALNRRLSQGTLPIAWLPNHKTNQVTEAKLACPKATLVDSTFGTDVILEPCSVSNSIIGNHCRIKKGARIVNCIIMDYVTIEEKAKLINSVIGSHCVISTESGVKSSYIGHNYTIHPKKTVSDQTLFNSTYTVDDDEYLNNSGYASDN